jgi:outer membrane protein
MFKRSIIALAMAGGALALASTAQAAPTMDEHTGTILVNVRFTDVDPGSGSPILTSAGASTGLSTDVSSSYIPSLGIDYFVTDNVSLELVLGTSHHTVKAVGTGADVVAHKTWVLPPTLVAKYHFAPKGQISPYVGAGLTWVIFYSGHDYNGFTVHLPNGVGEALQAGTDIAVTDKVNVNLDVKKIFFRTNASINAGALKSHVQLDPWVFSAGVGYRF